MMYIGNSRDIFHGMESVHSILYVSLLLLLLIPSVVPQTRPLL